MGYRKAHTLEVNGHTISTYDLEDHLRSLDIFRGSMASALASKGEVYVEKSVQG